MSSNQDPFEQQNDNPFGQQSGGFQGPSGFSQPQQPKKRGGGAGRTCLIVVVAVMACCVLCVGALVVGALSYRPVVPAIMWVAMVQSEGADQTGNIVCPDSDAEAFSVAFAQEYGTVTTFEFNDLSVDNDNDTTTFQGSFETSDGQNYNFDAVFVIDPDNGQDFLSSFGCVDEINPVEGQQQVVNPIGGGGTGAGDSQ